MLGYIYKVRNKTNGKIYIGQKQSKMYNPDYYGSGVIIQKAIKKYGKDSFELSLLDIAYSLEELNKKEELYIKSLKSTVKDGNYNIADGGKGIRVNTERYLYVDIEKLQESTRLDNFSTGDLGKLIVLCCYTTNPTEGKRYILTKNKKKLSNKTLGTILNTSTEQSRHFKSKAKRAGLLKEDDRGIYVPEDFFMYSVNHLGERPEDKATYTIKTDVIIELFSSIHTKLSYKKVNLLTYFIMLLPYANCKGAPLFLQACVPYIIEPEYKEPLSTSRFTSTGKLKMTLIYSDMGVSRTSISRYNKDLNSISGIE